MNHRHIILEIKKCVLLFKLVLLLVFFTQTMVYATGGIMIGSGTATNPYLIQDYADLSAIGSHNYTLSAIYRLANDIDASASDTANSGAGFLTIGNYTANFTGTFHGAGHSIKYLFINRFNINYIGLFGVVSSIAIIDSLGMTNANIRGRSYVGGVAGSNYGTITNCFVTGTIIGSPYINYDYDFGYEPYVVGGIVGRNSGVITNCYATGDLTGNEDVGGVAGFNSGTITNCYASENVAGTYLEITLGGVVGINYGSVTKCYATGNISGSHLLGGIVGSNSGIIINCYATGNVVCTNLHGDGIGGVVGSFVSGTIANCYATGMVSGYNELGGFLGDNGIYNCTITNCYWNTQTSKQVYWCSNYNYSIDSNFAIGLTTVQMKQSSYFSGWDFSGVWIIRTDSTYPGLCGVDNAPFAFADSLKSNRTFALSKLLMNDYDIETGQKNLVLKVISASEGIKDSDGTMTFQKSIVNGSIDTITYRVGEVRAKDTLWGNSAMAIVTLDTTLTSVALNSQSLIPKVLSLTNYPDPFNPTTTIQFSVEKEGQAIVKVFDILGREVTTLYNSIAKSGQYYTVIFNGSRYSSGVYFYTIESNNRLIAKKMLLLK